MLFVKTIERLPCRGTKCRKKIAKVFAGREKMSIFANKSLN